MRSNMKTFYITCKVCGHGFSSLKLKQYCSEICRKSKTNNDTLAKGNDPYGTAKQSQDK